MVLVKAERHDLCEFVHRPRVLWRAALCALGAQSTQVVTHVAALTLPLVRVFSKCERLIQKHLSYRLIETLVEAATGDLGTS